jgi:hypothetical protein
VLLAEATLTVSSHGDANNSENVNCCSTASEVTATAEQTDRFVSTFTQFQKTESRQCTPKITSGVEEIPLQKLGIFF